jgi:tyrosine-protein phosphatase YwqE
MAQKQRFTIDTEEEANKLIYQLRMDAVTPGIPEPDRKEAMEKVEPRVLLYNLLTSGKYKFSLAIYNKIFDNLWNR